MSAEYVESALRQARFERLEDNSGWYADIPGLQGVYGEGATMEACRADLRETLLSWLDLRSERNLPIPPVSGIEYGSEMEALGAELRST